AVHDAERGGGIVLGDRDAGEACLAGGADVFQATPPLVAIEPVGGPDVQLLEVEGFHAKVAEALLGGGDDVVARKHVGDWGAGRRRPYAILRRNLGGDVNALTGGTQ